MHIYSYERKLDKWFKFAFVARFPVVHGHHIQRLSSFLPLAIMISSWLCVFPYGKDSQECGHIWSLLQTIYWDLTWGCGWNPGRSCSSRVSDFLLKVIQMMFVAVQIYSEPGQPEVGTWPTLPDFCDVQLLVIPLLIWLDKSFQSVFLILYHVLHYKQ